MRAIAASDCESVALALCLMMQRANPAARAFSAKPRTLLLKML
jgi:hypothetical protein